MTKNFVGLHISETIYQMIVIYGARGKMIIFTGAFFQFFKVLFFWITSVVKEQKMAKNKKKFCLLHLIFQEE